MATVFRFFFVFFRYAINGSRLYRGWLLFLLVFTLPWAYAAHQQFTLGMGVTGLSDQVSWGIYIANFTFLVGVAAAALCILFPAYVYNYQPLKKVAVFGEILAISAVFMCMLFIVFHMGRPDRLWHMIPLLGTFSFPASMLAWDTLVLVGYLFLNMLAAGYYLYKRYQGQEINKRFYLTLIIVSLFWALSIHTVTAFLFSTLPARPMWHHSILPIRFIASAFASGSALIIVLFLIIRKTTTLWIEDQAINLLSTITVASLGLVLFLTLSELVTELYHPTELSAGLHYLMFGHGGLSQLVFWFWSSLLAMLIVWLSLMVPTLRKNYRVLPWLCVLLAYGIWVEKGIALVLPGSIPSPIGEYIEYSPSAIEIINCLGSWALGFLLLTILIRGSVGVLNGNLTSRVPLNKEAGGHA